MSHSAELNTDFFDLGEDQLALVREGYALVKGDMEDLLGTFYDFAMGVPEIASFFEDKALLAHARERQAEHWDMLLSGRLDAAYIRSAKIIGTVHFKIELPFHMYLGAYSRVASMVMSCLLEKLQEKAEDGEQVTRMVCAITRAFTLDTELVIRAFFDAQQAEQTRALALLDAGLSRITNGQAAEPILDAGAGAMPARYDSLRVGYNRALDLITTASQTIGNMTYELEESIRSVNSATDDLAKRTEVQADTLEQSAAAVDKLTQSVKAASENVSSVGAEARAARTHAQKAQGIVAEAVQSMTEIAASSKLISSKIGAINQIAFQTSLLALNAGVEAARAGDHGRGFAVVATEVRALAGRAAETAKEINDIISFSTEQVDSGSDKVGRTGDALKDITENIGRVSALIEDIDTTTTEQSRALESVNQAIGSLDATTQKNAAMAEETSAAALTMSLSFDSLADAVYSLGARAEAPVEDARRPA